ncbi:MAG: hypothetical protein ACFFCH_00075 [Promethearchaeota archaeon]
MSVHGASHFKCMACDAQTSIAEARSQWWICTTCGSYICPSCRVLLLETGQGICPGAIIQGSEPHSPHFTRFLGPREPTPVQEPQQRSTVTFLDDVPRRPKQQPGGKVVILPDQEDPEPVFSSDPVGQDDDN